MEHIFCPVNSVNKKRLDKEGSNEKSRTKKKTAFLGKAAKWLSVQKMRF